MIRNNIIVKVFMNTAFHRFASLAEKRDRSEVTW